MTSLRPETEPRTVRFILVPHTHWDREWYEPFEVFRRRLVRVMDDILDRLETDPDFRFTLDGQAAAAVDYLEMRPESTDRVRRAAARGALALGPWYILMDEFSCSGETIVRNLERGRAVSALLGSTMPVGHLPDMFGHIAQMPQILAGFGIEHAAMWRGVPAFVTDHGFRWRAPDGSEIRAENLFDGYANALDLFANPVQFDAEVVAYLDRTAAAWTGDPVLGLVGSDHTAPASDLMDLIRGFRGSDAVQLQVGTLGEYVAALAEATPPVAVVTGELRSHARGNILPGVYSIRTMLKAAMARAEDFLIVGEAFDALYGQGGNAPFLDLGWRRVIESTAHDSVTGCGVDQTAAQVEARLDSAAQLGRAVRDTVLEPLAARTPADAVFTANALPWPRPVQVEVEAPLVPGHEYLAAVDADGNALPTQRIGDLPTVLGEETLASVDLDRILHRIHGRELFGQLIEDYHWTDDSLTFTVTRAPRAEVFDLARLREEIADASVRPGPWQVRTLAEPRARVLVEVPTPALGCASARLVPVVAPVTEPSGVSIRVIDGVVHLLGDRVAAAVAPSGSCTVTGEDGTVLRGVGALVDDGDRGDSYNFGPTIEPAIANPTAVRIEAVEQGPLRAIVQVDRDYALPVEVDADDRSRRSAHTVRQRVRTLVEVRRGEPFVRLTVRFVNMVRDHRLRLHVPTAVPTDHTLASGQFALTRRGMSGEGGWGEFPLPTYPAYESVSAGGAHVLVDKLTEYELVGPQAPVQGEELALTLVRAVGLMSVNLHPLRDEPAGSEIPVPGAQYEGVEVTARFGVLPCALSPAEADVARWAQVLRDECVGGSGSAPRSAALPGPVAGVAVQGPAVMSALRRLPDDGVELRLVATGEVPATVAVSGLGERLHRTDLAGNILNTVTSGAVDIHPGQIVTLRTTGARPTTIEG